MTGCKWTLESILIHARHYVRILMQCHHRLSRVLCSVEARVHERVEHFFTGFRFFYGFGKIGSTGTDIANLSGFLQPVSRELFLLFFFQAYFVGSWGKRECRVTFFFFECRVNVSMCTYSWYFFGYVHLRLSVLVFSNVPADIPNWLIPLLGGKTIDGKLLMVYTESCKPSHESGPSS